MGIARGGKQQVTFVFRDEHTDLHGRIKRQAAHEGVTLGEFFVNVMEEYLTTYHDTSMYLGADYPEADPPTHNPT